MEPKAIPIRWNLIFISHCLSRKCNRKQSINILSCLYYLWFFIKFSWSFNARRGRVNLISLISLQRQPALYYFSLLFPIYSIFSISQTTIEIPALPIASETILLLYFYWNSTRKMQKKRPIWLPFTNNTWDISSMFLCPLHAPKMPSSSNA